MNINTILKTNEQILNQNDQFVKCKNFVFGKRLLMNSIAKCLKTKRKNYARKKKNHLMTV